MQKHTSFVFSYNNKRSLKSPCKAPNAWTLYQNLLKSEAIPGHRQGPETRTITLKLHCVPLLPCDVL